MKVCRQFAALLLNLCVATLPVAAADLALLLRAEPGGNDTGAGAVSDTQSHPRSDQGQPSDWDALSDRLSAAGFRITSISTDDPQEIVATLQTHANTLGSDRNRVVLVTDGNIVEDDPSDWVVFSDEQEIWLPDLETKGVRISDLARALGRSGGSVAVVVLQTGAQPGLTASQISPKTSVVWRPDTIYVALAAADAGPFLEHGLLRDGVSYAELRGLLPDGASLAGSLAQDRGFMMPPVPQEGAKARAQDAGTARIAQTPETGKTDAAETDAGETDAGETGAGEVEGGDIEDQLWQRTQEFGSEDAYGLYLSLYPNGRYAARAEENLTALRLGGLETEAQEEAELELTDAQRQDVQRYLNVLEFDAGPVDGAWGDRTRTALRDWQLWSEFPVTGFLNAKQLGILRTQALAQEEKNQAAALEQERVDREYWMATGQRGSEQELRAYLSRFPNGRFADLAMQRLQILDEALIELQQRASGVGKPPVDLGTTPQPPEVIRPKARDVRADPPAETPDPADAPAASGAEDARAPGVLEFLFGSGGQGADADGAPSPAPSKPAGSRDQRP